MTTLKKPRRDYRSPTGAKLTGVTSILGKHLGWKTDALIGWAHKLGREGRALRERDDAAAQGSCTHAIVAAELGGDAVDLEEWRADHMLNGRPNAMRVIELIRSQGWTVIGVEVAITAESFGGTIDLVVRDDDGRVLIVDLKTGKGSYNEMAVQLGAYSWLWRVECSRRGQPECFATEGAIIHAYAGEPIRLHRVSAAALAAGEHVFRKLLDIEEVAHAVVVGEVENG